MRGATEVEQAFQVRLEISIHAPHARSDYKKAEKAGYGQISIHAPHARSDSALTSNSLGPIDFNPRSSCEERHKLNVLITQTNVFQSTLLMRGATGSARNLLFKIPISIHAPHARSDWASRLPMPQLLNFNPRSSCEERPGEWISKTTSSRLFQSTLLMRGATAMTHDVTVQRIISIHAPHARSDLAPLPLKRRPRFQSTLLMRGATFHRRFS